VNEFNIQDEGFFISRAAMPKDKKGKQPLDKSQRHNKKAFTYSGGINAQKMKMQRLGDLQAKRDRKTVIDKTPQNEGPPFVVVVQGPPGVGKTTLIRSLVKHYSKAILGADIEGPVTLVSGRIRRLTFIECPANDMRAMLDLGKIADLVLLMVDASREGFEMETFEFINILQVHGFPRVMGVLTHLDTFKDTKRLRRTRKTFKSRFWSELYDGAKMFYLSGLQYGNRYNKTEILNMARFISVQRFPPLTWRQTHPYMLGLRCETHLSTTDTSDEDPRLQVSVYGYVAGSRLRQGQLAHIPGLGDYPISKVETVVDPCPLPQQIANAEKGELAKDFSKSTGAALRSLADKHKSIYAPYCDAEHIAVEKDAMYISLRNHTSHFTSKDDMVKGGAAESDGWSSESGDDEETQNEAVRMVRELHQTMKKSAVVNTTDNDDDDDDDDQIQFVKNGVSVSSRKVVVVHHVDASGDNDKEGGIMPQEFTTGMVRGSSWLTGTGRNDDLNDIVYGGRNSRVMGREKKSPADDSKVEHLFSSDDDDDIVDYRASISTTDEGDIDSEFRRADDDDDSSDDEGWISRMADKLRRKKVFSEITLQGGGEKAAAADTDEDEDSEDDESIIHNNESMDASREANAADKAAVMEARKLGLDGAAPEDEEGVATTPETGYRRKIEGTGGVVQSVAKMNEEGAFEIGQFVRVIFENIPAEFEKPLCTPSRPLIVGGLPTGAESRGGSADNLGGISGAGNAVSLLHIKRHRWSPKILKNMDPVLVSAGWRRFQSVPIYAIEDRDGKRRMLKYTPEHMHCYCLVSAPVVPPNTGVMFIRDWRAIPHYRVSATGLVVEGAEKFKVLKKIKLVGEPYKVHDKTAFIKGMFTSDLEVEKSLHARIQTVSGIKGEIKKPHKDKGDFRAMFGHKIQMSDLVVMKAWVPVEVPTFCNPMIDLDIWPRMRSINEVRRDTATPIPNKADSSYGTAKQDRSKISNKFSKIRIPTKVMNALPFKSKLKVVEQKSAKVRKAEKEDMVRGSGQIVLPGSSEADQAQMRKVRSVIHGLNVVRKTRIEARKSKNAEKKALKEKREAFIVEKRDAYKKEATKRHHAITGANEAKDRKRMRLDKGGKKSAREALD